MWTVIGLYSRGGAHRLGVPSQPQKIPAWVWSAVRSVGVMTPSPLKRFTSLKAAVYSGLFMAGKGGTRN